MFLQAAEDSLFIPLRMDAQRVFHFLPNGVWLAFPKPFMLDYKTDETQLHRQVGLHPFKWAGIGIISAEAVRLPCLLSHCWHFSDG